MKLKINPSFVRDTKKSPRHIIVQLDTIFSLITAAKKPGDIPNLKSSPVIKMLIVFALMIIESVC